MAFSSQQSQIFIEPQRTTLIPVEELDVQCEMLIDLENLRDNGFDLFPAVMFQGWTQFFDRLFGPVFPPLVKEFWIHAVCTPKAILSFVMGKEISITENVIRRLLDLQGEGEVEIPKGRVNMDLVYEEIFTSGEASTKIKDLKDTYKLWAKIFISCIFHRKESSSPDYINQDQQYLLYCIGKNIKVDLAYLLFNHLWTHVKETREGARTKNPKARRNWIPLSRLISDVLTENGLIHFLEETNLLPESEAVCGKTLNGNHLLKRKIINELVVKPTPVVWLDVQNRENPLAEFPRFNSTEHSAVVETYIRHCINEGIEVDPAWMQGKSLPSPARKRKAAEEGTSKVQKKRAKKTKGTSSDPISIATSVNVVTSDTHTPAEPQTSVLPETHNPNTTAIPEPNPNIDQILSDIDNFDVQTTNSETPSTQPQPIIIDISSPDSPEQIPTSAPSQTPPSTTFSHQKPREWQPDDASWLLPGINMPLNTQFPPFSMPSENIFSIPPINTTVFQAPLSPQKFPTPHSPEIPPSSDTQTFPLSLSPSELLSTPTSESSDFLRTEVNFDALPTKPKTTQTSAPNIVHTDVNILLQKFEIEMQGWMDLLKANCAENLNPAASDVLWTTFRRRFNAESLKLKELCYSHIHGKFAAYLSVFKTEVLDLWDKKPLLQLDNAPWQPPSDPMVISDDESSDSEVADSNPLALVLSRSLPFRAEANVKKAPRLMIPLDSLLSTFVGSGAVAESSKTASSADTDTATTSVVLETLKELKTDNNMMLERLNKQDETIKEMQSWMKKQEESSDEIKALLRSLVSRQP